MFMNNNEDQQRRIRSRSIKRGQYKQLIDQYLQESYLHPKQQQEIFTRIYQQDLLLNEQLSRKKYQLKIEMDLNESQRIPVGRRYQDLLIGQEVRIRQIAERQRQERERAVDDYPGQGSSTLSNFMNSWIKNLNKLGAGNLCKLTIYPGKHRTAASELINTCKNIRRQNPEKKNQLIEKFRQKIKKLIKRRLSQKEKKAHHLKCKKILQKILTVGCEIMNLNHQLTEAQCIKYLNFFFNLGTQNKGSLQNQNLKIGEGAKMIMNQPRVDIIRINQQNRSKIQQFNRKGDIGLPEIAYLGRIMDQQNIEENYSETNRDQISSTRKEDSNQLFQEAFNLLRSSQRQNNMFNNFAEDRTEEIREIQPNMRDQHRSNQLNTREIKQGLRDEKRQNQLEKIEIQPVLIYQNSPNQLEWQNVFQLSNQNVEELSNQPIREGMVYEHFLINPLSRNESFSNINGNHVSLMNYQMANFK